MRTFLKDLGIALEALGILAAAAIVFYLKFRFYAGVFSFNKKSDIQTLFPKD